MKVAMLGLAVVLLVGIASATFAGSSDLVFPDRSSDYAGQRVVRFVVRGNGSVLQQVEDWAVSRRFDVWALNSEWVDVRVPAGTTLEAEASVAGIPYTVMSPDLQLDIEAERAAIVLVAGRELSTDSFFDTYRTLEEFNKFLELLASEHPTLVTKLTIGKTVEGRPIQGVRIASPKNTGNVGIVYNGGQHSREWISPMTNAYIAHQLASLYGKDAGVTRMLDEIEWTIIPVLNADGYVYTWITNRMWRKNRRFNEDSWYGCYGVDMNRNWAFHWGEGGSSGDTCSDTYRGPKPASEPEVMALVDYISARPNIKGYADIHSYSQLWMSPWGWTTAQVPKDYPTQNELSKLAVDAIKSVHNKVYGYGPSAKVIYVASGGADDWTYGVHNVTWSYSIELRDTGRYGFVLPPSEIVPTGQEIFAAVRVMADYILDRV